MREAASRPFGADHGAVAGQGRVRVEPVDRFESEPPANGRALGLVGGKLDPLAVADLVEPKVVGEAVDHSYLPLASLLESLRSSVAHSAFSAAVTWCSAAAAGSTL